MFFRGRLGIKLRNHAVFDFIASWLKDAGPGCLLMFVSVWVERLGYHA